MEHFRVRSTDPLTSFEAADSIQPTADKHYELILWCLGHFGPLGKADRVNRLPNRQAIDRIGAYGFN